MTDRRSFRTTALAGGGWVSLVDAAAGQSLAGCTEIDAGHWAFVDGALQGRNGKRGYLVTRGRTPTARSAPSSGPTSRPTAASSSAARTASRSVPTTPMKSTSSTVGPTPATAPPPSISPRCAVALPQAANRGNTVVITAKGDRLVVVFNGQQTVDIRNDKFESGPVALQSAGGTIRFRKVSIKPL
jgi:hypothetical protein